MIVFFANRRYGKICKELLYLICRNSRFMKNLIVTIHFNVPSFNNVTEVFSLILNVLFFFFVIKRKIKFTTFYSQKSFIFEISQNTKKRLNFLLRTSKLGGNIKKNMYANRISREIYLSPKTVQPRTIFRCVQKKIS